MTFKQKLAKTLISEIQICQKIASDKARNSELEEASRWRSKVYSCQTIAETMFGINSEIDHRDCVKELQKFLPK